MATFLSLRFVERVIVPRSIVMCPALPFRGTFLVPHYKVMCPAPRFRVIFRGRHFRDTRLGRRFVDIRHNLHFVDTRPGRLFKSPGDRLACSGRLPKSGFPKSDINSTVSATSVFRQAVFVSVLAMISHRQQTSVV